LMGTATPSEITRTFDSPAPVEARGYLADHLARCASQGRIQMSDGFRTGLRRRLERANQQIKNQHERLRGLLRAAEGAAREGRSLREPLHRLRQGLDAHFDIEESISFPALHGLEPSAGAEIAQLCGDHRAFLEELARLLGGDEPDAPARVLQLGSALADHERREEALLAQLLPPAPRARDPL
jgi:Hemerythrin HHE cation binding domain